MLYERFVDAIAMTPSEQRKFIDKIATTNPQMADELRAMLAAEHPSDTDQLTLFDWHKISDDRSLIGSQFGPFQITSLISRGGMGSVYLAQRNDQNFEQTVAIKVIDEQLEALIGRHALIREAAVMARLNHPDIGKVFDAGVNEQGHHYILMEYVAGKQIDQVVAERQLSLRQRLTIFVRLCQAVDYAHSMQVVHADLKPSNILLDDYLQVKVLDFGISRMFHNRDSQHSNIYQSYIRALTKAFASPELLESGHATPSSDIFALGIVLQHLLAVAPACRSIRYHAELDAIIAKATQAKTAERYTSLQQIISDIEDFKAGLVATAYPASRWYRLNKLVRRRHPVLSSTILFTSIFCTYLLFNLLTQYGQLKVAKHQSDLMVNRLSDIVQLADRRISNGDNFSALDMLNNSADVLTSDTELSPDSKARIQLALAGGYASIGENALAKQNFAEILRNWSVLKNKDLAFEAAGQWIKLLTRGYELDQIDTSVGELLPHLTFDKDEKLLPNTVAQAMFYHRYLDGMKWQKYSGANGPLAERHIALLRKIKQQYWQQLTQAQQAEILGFLARAILYQLPKPYVFTFQGMDDQTFDSEAKPSLTEAYALLKRVKQLYADLNQTNDVARTEYVLMILAEELDMPQKALQFGEHAFALQQQILGPQHPDLIAQYVKLADYLQTSHLTKSIDYANQGIQLAQRHHDNISAAQYADVYVKLLNGLYLQGDTTTYQQQANALWQDYLTRSKSDYSLSYIRLLQHTLVQSLWLLPQSHGLTAVATKMKHDLLQLADVNMDDITANSTDDQRFITLLDSIIEQSSHLEVLSNALQATPIDNSRSQHVYAMKLAWLKQAQHQPNNYQDALLNSEKWHSRELSNSLLIVPWLLMETEIWQQRQAVNPNANVQQKITHNLRVISHIIIQQQLPLDSLWRQKLRKIEQHSQRQTSTIQLAKKTI